MSSWGPKLYQNDIAQDICEQFQELLRSGESAKYITNKLIDKYGLEIIDDDDSSVFWFALADTQWRLGLLLPEVKQKAIECIDSGKDQERWQRENIEVAKARSVELIELRNRLNSPMPSEKKIAIRGYYKCGWKVGDVFAYNLNNDFARERGLYGRYFIFRKIDEVVYHPGHIIPIVWVKITANDVLPKSEKDFNALEYVQTAAIAFKDRFLPYDGNGSIEEQIEEKSIIKYEVDDFGLLPVYRLKLINTSKKLTPAKLIHIGNFQSVMPPDKEFIPHSKLSIPAFSWKFFDKLMIDRYCGYNLRQYRIYQNH